jgi:hypothetical protein
LVFSSSVFNKKRIAISINKQQNSTSMNGLNEKNLRIVYFILLVWFLA